MERDSDEIPQAAIAALRRGNKIEAIKLTREASGMGLKESKDVVEGELRNNSELNAVYQEARPKGSGGGLFISLALILFVIYWFVFRN